MKSIKGLAQAGFLVLATMLLVGSCSDKDYSQPPPTPSPAEVEIQEVLKELDKVEGVNEFVQALKGASSTITVDLDEEKLTVFAPKNYSKTRATDETLKRHIAKGATDISVFSGDTLKLETLSGEKLCIVKAADGTLLVNGISLAQDKRIDAGKSYVYIVSETLPATETFIKPKYEVKFKVLEFNREWSAENDPETLPSDKAMIKIYKEEAGKYTVIDSVETDAQGYALFKHSYTFDLYYTVRDKDSDLSMNYRGYLPVGIFTTQAEIDAAPKYRTGTPMDDLYPGSIKVADLNGDMLINESDKLTSDYFMVDQEDETVVYLAPFVHSTAPPSITEETIKEAIADLSFMLGHFIDAHYDTDSRLIRGAVNFPSLENFSEANTMWGLGIQYIKSYLWVKKAIKNSSNPTSLINIWNEYYSDSEFAYVYLTLISYYGDFPLFTEDNVDAVWDIVRNKKSEIVAYIESESKYVSAPNLYAIKTLLARYYANEGNYNLVRIYTDEIINAGGYALVPDPLLTGSNDEVILGGYVLLGNRIYHPVRYSEVILLAADAAFEKGDDAKALQYVNQIKRVNKEMEYTTVTKEIIRGLWDEKFAGEGQGYMLLNRWETLLDILGPYGAKDYNKLLPIPEYEMIVNPGLTQNPGY